eukprot:1553989-Pyramimonas_sp.AAC.1
MLNHGFEAKSIGSAAMPLRRSAADRRPVPANATLRRRSEGGAHLTLEAVMKLPEEVATNGF